MFLGSLSATRKTHTVTLVWLLFYHMYMYLASVCCVSVSLNEFVYVRECVRKGREGVCMWCVGEREREREREKG